MTLSTNLILLVNWDKHHTWPSRTEIPDIVTRMTNLKIPNVVKKINRRIYVDQKLIYDYLESKKAKELIKFYKRMKDI